MIDKNKLVEYLTAEINSVNKRLAFFQRDGTDPEAIKEYADKVEILKEIKLVVINAK